MNEGEASVGVPSKKEKSPGSSFSVRVIRDHFFQYFGVGSTKFLREGPTKLLPTQSRALFLFFDRKIA
jgi:hypothetical protein